MLPGLETCYIQILQVNIYIKNYLDRPLFDVQNNDRGQLVGHCLSFPSIAYIQTYTYTSVVSKKYSTLPVPQQHTADNM